MQTISESIEVAGLDGGAVKVAPDDIESLRRRIDGQVLLPGDPGWEDAVDVWNGMVAKVPALVVQPVSASDVAATVAFAREHRALTSVKGGGHNIAGTSIAEDGMTIDMARMNGIAVDPEARVADVGPGCRLGDVDRATQEHGLATVLGFISDTGVAGLTLGGGLGYLTRRFGWTVDNLVEAEVVTADGSIVVADRDRHPDLFWALRGGGGNFGIVTRFRFRLHPVGPTVFGGLVAWPFSHADEVLRAYRALTASAPRELAVWLVLMHAPPAPFVPEEAHGAPICAMSVCYSGDLERVDEVLAPIRALPEPAVDLLHPQPYTELQSYLDDGEPRGAHYYWKTEFVADLPDEFLDEVRDVFAGCPMPEAQVGFLHLAGALNEFDADDGAVGNRDARFAIGVNGMWEPGHPEADAFRDWVRTSWSRLRGFSTGGNYINFQTADEDETRIRATYGANLARLTEIKKTYDPDNLFRVNRNITPGA